MYDLDGVKKGVSKVSPLLVILSQMKNKKLIYLALYRSLSVSAGISD